MSEHDVVPVAWTVWREIPAGDDLVLYREAKATRPTALQLRIDDLEKDAVRHSALIKFLALGYTLVCGRYDELSGPADWVMLDPVGNQITDFYDDSGDAIDAAIKANP